MIKGIFGINIAVNDVAAATAKFEKLLGVKAKPLGAGDFAFPGLSGVQLALNGVHINLITSSVKDTSIAKFLEKKGEGLFLLSVESDAIDTDVESLKGMGLEVLLPKTVRGDFGAVNFVHPRSMHGVQVEVYQPAK